MLELLLKILFTTVFILLSVAFFTVAERKIIGSIQRRKGPNVLGNFGLLQAFADGLKLLLKESIIPSSANKVLFVIAPCLTFFLSLMVWAVLPCAVVGPISDIYLGVILIFIVSSLEVYGVILGGWASNSRYAFLGGLRSTAQMISYEITIGFSMVSIILVSGTFNLIEIILKQEKMWYFLPFLPLFIMFVISCLAETNRHPFDLPEAEAELVSGYNVEYSSVGFTLFFLGEYVNILLISSLCTIFFIGGWFFPGNFIGPSYLWFSIKTFLFMIVFIWARAAFPRYRYDQLIRLGWKVFLPFSMSFVVLVSGILIGVNWLPLFCLTTYGQYSFFYKS